MKCDSIKINLPLLEATQVSFIFNKEEYPVPNQDYIQYDENYYISLLNARAKHTIKDRSIAHLHKIDHELTADARASGSIEADSHIFSTKKAKEINLFEWLYNRSEEAKKIMRY